MGLLKIQVAEKHKKKVGYGLLFSLISFGLFLMYLPADYFDTGEAMCLSVRFFDVECYGCGLTRGVMHLIHFEFVEAWEFNKLTFIVFPLLVYTLLFEIWQRFLKPSSQEEFPPNQKE
jgi:hypothetical protein